MVGITVRRECLVQFARFSLSSIDRAQSPSDVITFWCLVLLSTCLVPVIKCLCLSKRLEIRLKIFIVAYMNNKKTWSLVEGYCQFEAKFLTLMIERHFPPQNFRAVAKIQRKSFLCSNEISPNRLRTFDERSSEQKTKFAEFRLHYFCTIL